jgi:hypothetical protein
MPYGMLRAILLVLLGAVLGIVGAAPIVWFGGAYGGVRVGPWATPLDAGGAGRGAYTRAVVAIRATMGLSRRETIYFGANTDSAGEKLTGNCTYEIHGPDLPTRWWSITLYGSDHYLIANPQNRFSYASANIARDPDNGFTITVSPKPAPGNWLNTAGAPGLVLLTRLYQPLPQAASDPAHIPLPAIHRVECE